MKTTQRLKQEIFKQVQASGLFKEVQSKLKMQVLNLTDKQSNQNKRQLGFQYEHPLLNKLRKYPLTALCLDLIQQFLQSFKFKYTLSVFKKEINRDINLDRLNLANNFQIEMKNPQTQAVLLSLVSQLVSGDIKINPNKLNNAFTATNKIQNNPRINNFIGGNQSQKSTQQTIGNNFNKKPIPGVSEISNSNNSFNQKSKSNTSFNNSTSQQQKSSNISNNQSVSQTPSSSIIDQSIKPSQSQVSEVKEEVKEEQPPKEDKTKKGKKKKQVQKPPEGATDLMGELMSKFNTKDQKAQQEEKKKKLFEEKRAFSQEKAQKVLDPSESGANKIRGVSMGKMSSFLSKFLPPQANTAKNENQIEEQLDEFQQSKDSTRKNPLFSSSESGFDKSGYYDVSVDSNAINDFEYVQKAKKSTKK